MDDNMFDAAMERSNVPTVTISPEVVEEANKLGINAVGEVAAALEADGQRVYHINVGDMPIDEAAELIEHVKRSITKKKKFLSTKTFGNDRGLSCCFRQWRATHSHCSTVHGYSIGVKFTFECEELDERNWVFDFGGLKDIKKWLEYMFDHTMVVAEDDPLLSFWKNMAENPETAHAIDLRVVPGVGCERFAELVFDKVTQMLDEQRDTMLNKTVQLKSVEVFEHGANSSICERD